MTQVDPNGPKWKLNSIIEDFIQQIEFWFFFFWMKNYKKNLNDNLLTKMKIECASNKKNIVNIALLICFYELNK